MIERDKIWKYMAFLQIFIGVSCVLFIVIGVYQQVVLYHSNEDLHGCKGKEFIVTESINSVLFLAFLIPITKA